MSTTKVLIMIFICPCKNLNKLSISNKYGKIWDKAVDSFGDSVSNRDVGVFVNNLVSVGSNVARIWDLNSGILVMLRL